MPDNTKFKFNTIEYGKNRLVLAVIQQFVSDNKPTLESLLSAFPPELQGSHGVFITVEEFNNIALTRPDIKRRYFSKESETIKLSDGQQVFICSQWGTSADGEGNIDRFIDRAKELGYEIQAIGNTTKSIKDLYEEYKAKPRAEWISNYKARCQQFSEYKNKDPEEIDKAFLIDIWKNPANGIAKVGPGFLSNDEFESLLPELPAITARIINDPSIETLQEIYNWAGEAKKKGQFKTLKWGVIHRVFSAAAPNQYSTILNRTDLKALINALNSRFGLDIHLGKKHDWGTPMVNLMSAIKAQGLDDEDVFLVNTFAWRLYQLFVSDKDKSINTKSITDEENSMEDNSSSCRNTIYYGPPGTGKTFKLQNILKSSYTDYEEVQERKPWLIAQLEELSWFEIIAIIILDFDGPRSVSDIVSHEYYQLKIEMNARKANTNQTAWSALQTHTVADSVTVKYERRVEPQIFDKTKNSLWYIVDDEAEQLEAYKELVSILKEGPNKAETIKRYEFVTFHQSYSYEEFIEGLRPETNENGDITYKVKPGVFKKICKLATDDPNNQYALVIDEINRGNISKIFGELITLIEVDKRVGEENRLTVTLPYSGLPFSVPSNLDIIGTMNTADRSLTHIDVALRRRFDFKELRTDYSLISTDVDGINIRHMLYAINQRIELLLDREHILGHALLMKVNSVSSLEHAFKTNIMPLLEEYFFENWDKIDQVLNNNGFIEEQKEAHSVWLGGVDDYAAKSYRVNLTAFNDVEAYKKIYSGIAATAFSECDKA
jgi:5-methylcytosine-specific restriction protein B